MRIIAFIVLLFSQSLSAQVILQRAHIERAVLAKTNAPSGGGGSDTEIVTSADTSGSTRNDTTGEVGFQFTVQGGNIVVTSLGRWVLSGNSGTHLLVLRSADCST